VLSYAWCGCAARDLSREQARQLGERIGRESTHVSAPVERVQSDRPSAADSAWSAAEERWRAAEQARVHTEIIAVCDGWLNERGTG